MCVFNPGKENKKKKGEKKSIRQGNGNRVNVSNFIYKEWYIFFAHAPKYTYHCLLLCGVKYGTRDASCELDIFWMYILFVYNLVIWLLGTCNCLSHIHNCPIISIYDHVLKKPKTSFFVFEKILWVFHLKTLTRPYSFI